MHKIILLFLSLSLFAADFKPTKQNEFLAPDSKPVLLWGDGVFTEGPTIDDDGNVLFTDIRVNKIMKYDRKSGKTTVFREKSNGANGLFFRKGKLYSCEGAGLQYASVAVTYADGSKAVLVDKYNGKNFNSPNDLAVTDNGIYFTDPRYGSMEGMQLSHESVYLIKGGKVLLATKQTERPNGILISHDLKWAFVADNNNRPRGARTLLKFKIKPDGTFANRDKLFSFRNDQRGIDGMAMDSEGNIYATAGFGKDSGIYVFSQKGEHLAFIELPDKPTNCTFGGPDEKDTLYITCAVKRQPNENKKFGLFKIKLKKSAK